MRARLKINEKTLEVLLLSIGKYQKFEAIVGRDMIIKTSQEPEDVFLFPNVKAIIYERAPLLSHITILTREYGVWCFIHKNAEEIKRKYAGKKVYVEILNIPKKIRLYKPNREGLIKFVQYIPPLRADLAEKEAESFSKVLKSIFDVDIKVIGTSEGLYISESDLRKIEKISTEKIIRVYKKYHHYSSKIQVILSLLVPLFIEAILRRTENPTIFYVKPYDVPFYAYPEVPKKYREVLDIPEIKTRILEDILRSRKDDVFKRKTLDEIAISLLISCYERKNWIIFGDDLITLREIYPRFLVGSKFFNLSILYQNKIPVPEAVCLTTKVFDYYQKHGDLLEPVKNTLENFVGDKLVAVRSSGVFEDLPNKSFAGIYKTILGVKKENLFDAIREVYNSAFSERVIKYFGKPTKMAVIVQYLIPTEKFAVVFTKNPVDKSESIVIESTFGLGEPLVSGKVTPEEIILNRNGEIIYRSNARIGEVLTVENNEVIRKKINYEGKILNDKEIEEIYKIALKIEEIFGKPQDIELGIYKGKVWVFQSRDITTL